MYFEIYSLLPVFEGEKKKRSSLSFKISLGNVPQLSCEKLDLGFVLPILSCKCFLLLPFFPSDLPSDSLHYLRHCLSFHNVFLEDSFFSCKNNLIELSSFPEHFCHWNYCCSLFSLCTKQLGEQRPIYFAFMSSLMFNFLILCNLVSSHVTLPKLISKIIGGFLIAKIEYCFHNIVYFLRTATSNQTKSSCPAFPWCIIIIRHMIIIMFIYDIYYFSSLNWLFKYCFNFWKY